MDRGGGHRGREQRHLTLYKANPVLNISGNGSFFDRQTLRIRGKALPLKEQRRACGETTMAAAMFASKAKAARTAKCQMARTASSRGDRTPRCDSCLHNENCADTDHHTAESMHSPNQVSPLIGRMGSTSKVVPCDKPELVDDSTGKPANKTKQLLEVHTESRRDIIKMLQASRCSQNEISPCLDVSESQRTTGFWKYKSTCRRVYSMFFVQVVVATMIIANFMTNIAEKQIWPSGNPSVPGGMRYKHVFGGFELFYNVSFTAELMVNMYAHWFFEFWSSGWNIFDFVTVAISWLFQFNLPLPGPLRLMRMVRALRVFRLFKRVRSLRKILESLARAVPGVVNAFLIMLIVMCIYAILAVDFFQTKGIDGDMHFEWCRGSISFDRRHEISFNTTSGGWEEVEITDCPAYYTSRGNDFGHEYFGNFFKALYTLFQVLTGDSWSEAIGRPLIDNWGPAATGFYFVSFYLLHAVVLINVVVAVLLEKMVEDEDDSQVDLDEADAALDDAVGNAAALPASDYQPNGTEAHLTDKSGTSSDPGVATTYQQESRHTFRSDKKRHSQDAHLERLILDVRDLRINVEEIQQNQTRILSILDQFLQQKQKETHAHQRSRTAASTSTGQCWDDDDPGH